MERGVARREPVVRPAGRGKLGRKLGGKKVGKLGEKLEIFNVNIVFYYPNKF
jgi:hypothetical protein